MTQTTPRGAAVAFYRQLVSSNEYPDACVIWPFATSAAGYAVFGQQRGLIKSSVVARVVCAEVNGLPPHQSYEASHNCGRGHLGCVNPGHLEWKTSKENKADQLSHGTRNKGQRNGKARLSDSQIAQIRALAGTPHKQIAEQFAINPSNVSLIMNRKRWEHI